MKHKLSVGDPAVASSRLRRSLINKHGSLEKSRWLASRHLDETVTCGGNHHGISYTGDTIIIMSSTAPTVTNNKSPARICGGPDVRDFRVDTATWRLRKRLSTSSLASIVPAQIIVEMAVEL